MESRVCLPAFCPTFLPVVVCPAFFPAFAPAMTWPQLRTPKQSQVPKTATIEGTFSTGGQTLPYFLLLSYLGVRTESFFGIVPCLSFS